MNQSKSVLRPHKLLMKTIKQNATKITKVSCWGARAPSRVVCRALAVNPLVHSVSRVHEFQQSSRWRGRHRQHARARALPRIFVSFVIFCNCLFFFCATGLAQNSDSVAEREVQRRQSAIPQGEAALARGKTAMAAKNITLAHEEFKTAVRYLPDSVVSGKAHDEAVEGFCKTGVILAEARIAQGDYAGAEAILSEILSSRYDPNCRPARELMAHLHQPGYFNKTMGPRFIAKVEEVKQLLTEADGFYKSGR